MSKYLSISRPIDWPKIYPCILLVSLRTCQMLLFKTRYNIDAYVTIYFYSPWCWHCLNNTLCHWVVCCMHHWRGLLLPCCMAWMKRAMRHLKRYHWCWIVINLVGSFVRWSSQIDQGFDSNQSYLASHAGIAKNSGCRAKLFSSHFAAQREGFDAHIWGSSVGSASACRMFAWWTTASGKSCIGLFVHQCAIWFQVMH